MERAEAGVGDLQLDRGLVLGRDRHRADRADLGPRDPHVLAWHRAGGVVEDRAHLVAGAAASAGCADAEHRRAGQAQHKQRTCRDPSHGPGG